MEINKYFDKNIMKIYLNYLIPTIISMVMYSFYIFADVLFISLGVGNIGLAALNIILPVFSIYSAFGMMLGVGCAVTMAILKGENKMDKAYASYTISLILILAISAISIIIIHFYATPIVIMLGANKEILPFGLEYIYPIGYSIPFYLLAGFLTVLVRSAGSPKIAMMAGLIGNGINIALDYVFVIPFGMGMFGAGLATGIGSFITFIMLLFHFKKDDHSLLLTRKFMDIGLGLRVIKNGLGAATLEASTALVIYLTNKTLMVLSGPEALAVFSVISNIGYVLKNLFSGFSQATQPMISSYYSRKNKHNLVSIVKIGFSISLACAIVSLLLIFVFPKELMALFLTLNPEIISMGTPAIRLFYSLFPMVAMNTMIMYYFQSVEEAKKSLLLSFLRGIILIFIGLIILPRFLGVTGVWITTPLAEGITFLIFLPIMIKHIKSQ